MKFIIASALLVAFASAFDTCEVCEKVMTPILSKATPAERQKVVDVLKGLCFGNAACEAKVDSISGDITSATPESLCTLVELCTKSTEKRGLFDICGLCEEGVDEIKSHVGNETAAQIKEKLELLCFGNAACKAEIDSVVDNINQASSQEICTDLKLCSSYKMFTFSGGRICSLCETFAAKALSKINNATLAQLEGFLDAACHGNSQCLDAVQKMLADLRDLTPLSVCQQVHLCGSATYFLADIKATDKCSACKTKLSDVLTNDVDKIASGLKSICHGNANCDAEVDKAVAMIKANKDKYIVQACSLAKQC